MGPPGRRSTGRPSPPPPRGGTSAPTASARRKGAHRRHGESQEGVPQAAAWNESREAAARHPPPPRPPTGPPAAGAPAPTPRGRRDGPPRPRGEPECDPPPRPSRRLQWGPRRASGPTPAHRDAAQIVPREAGWARTGMVWVATPPMDSTTPRDARFVAYPGKAAPQPANH